MSILKVKCDSVHEIEAGHKDSLSVHLRNVDVGELLQEIISNHGNDAVLDCISYIDIHDYMGACDE